ncbi:type VII secretion target [Actinokineospora iranica]|uniref:Excreted virulence factor EspC, type VII ESX diderm n=1 Tax=Actinokineospora iranica TaxID=1271860 RepID=A0A1G6M8P5_9PSEU|nr:type VII secretion target [Actinokineospora iranica]SDC51674.1 Excreted virulence factor EspC, type VII ESX diderm [Actinokineospora iranica]
MTPDQQGFTVDLAELAVLARTADDFADAIRTAWQRDWFEDDKWPDTDPLRTAVITYRRSLQAAMERLAGGTERLAEHLEAVRAGYQETDAEAASAIERVLRDR